MYNHDIMFTECTSGQQGVLQLSLLDDTVHHNNVPTNENSEEDSQLVLVSACDDPGQTITEGRS